MGEAGERERERERYEKEIEKEEKGETDRLKESGGGNPLTSAVFIPSLCHSRAVL